MRLSLPYGRYLTRDGSSVLFNRDYEPLVRMDSNGGRELCNPEEWVENLIGQEYFYQDDCTPCLAPRRVPRLAEILNGASIGEADIMLAFYEPDVRLSPVRPEERAGFRNEYREQGYRVRDM